MPHRPTLAVAHTLQVQHEHDTIVEVLEPVPFIGSNNMSSYMRDNATYTNNTCHKHKHVLCCSKPMHNTTRSCPYQYILVLGQAAMLQEPSGTLSAQLLPHDGCIIREVQQAAIYILTFTKEPAFLFASASCNWSSTVDLLPACSTGEPHWHNSRRSS